jgi:peptidoglycan/xylan/chitin deacetylase (PgdA/CDA1 family)
VGDLFGKIWSLRRSVAGAAIYWSGGGALYEALARPSGAIVLMYHSVAPADTYAFVDSPNRISPELFRRQMTFLARYRRVVPLSQLVEDLVAGKTPLAGTVSITFDDGYRDNLTTAAPILSELRLPATLFLATGYVERGQSQWADVLHWMISHRTSKWLVIPGEDRDAFNLDTAVDGRLAREALHRRLLEADYCLRCTLLDEVARQLSPRGIAPRLTLTWDEVRTLQRDFPLIDIGGHTRDHIDLSRHGDATAVAEINGCAADLRRELQLEPGHFSFPYGRWSSEARDIVISAGWRSAVGDGDNNRVGSASDRYCIPRVDAPRSMTELRFKTSGAYPDVLPGSRME